MSDWSDSGISPDIAGTTNKSFLDTAMGILDPSNARLKIAGLFAGGVSSKSQYNTLGINSSTINGGGNVEQDWRVRISLPEKSGLFYQENNHFQKILQRTNGVVFPYTPQIAIKHNARYQEQTLTHSNYKNYFYEGSDVEAISITGDFTVQNLDEGQYLLAAIYFFRSCTKMFFGAKDTQPSAGNPPPIVFLDGYGDFLLPHVSCVVTQFQQTMPPDVDYIQIPYSGSTIGTGMSSSGQSVRLPTTSQLMISVQPVYSRQNVYKNMSLNDYSNGKLLKGNGGFL